VINSKYERAQLAAGFAALFRKALYMDADGVERKTPLCIRVEGVRAFWRNLVRFRRCSVAEDDLSGCRGVLIACILSILWFWLPLGVLVWRVWR